MYASLPILEALYRGQISVRDWVVLGVHGLTKTYTKVTINSSTEGTLLTLEGVAESGLKTWDTSLTTHTLAGQRQGVVKRVSESDRAVSPVDSPIRMNDCGEILEGRDRHRHVQRSGRLIGLHPRIV